MKIQELIDQLPGIRFTNPGTMPSGANRVSLQVAEEVKASAIQLAAEGTIVENGEESYALQHTAPYQATLRNGKPNTMDLFSLIEQRSFTSLDEALASVNSTI